MKTKTEYDKYKLLVLTCDEMTLLNVIMNNYKFLSYVRQDQEGVWRLTLDALLELLGEDDVRDCFFTRSSIEIIIVGDDEIVEESS